VEVRKIGGSGWEKKGAGSGGGAGAGLGKGKVHVASCQGGEMGRGGGGDRRGEGINLLGRGAYGLSY